jgi:hypothetical protein
MCNRSNEILTFERGGFRGIIIGDDEEIGRRAVVNFSICRMKIIFDH